MRWRLGASLLTVLTSTVAVGAAVLGPLYLRTAGDSVVRMTVTSASVEARGVTLAAYEGQSASLGQIQRAARTIENAGAWYGPPITTVVSGVGLVGPGSSPLSSQLFSRTGICGVLHFQQGRCELGSGQVALSDRSARELKVSLGAVIEVSVPGSRRPRRLKVTGIYTVPNPTLSYWWGDAPAYFPFGHTTGPHRIPEIDSLIASPATALSVPAGDLPEVIGQVPLRAAQVGLGDESSLKRALSAASAELLARGIRTSTQLPALLAAADHQRNVMSTIVTIAAVQLVVLAIWVLGSLLVRNSDARRSEIRVARLRGFPATTMLGATVAEPAILCLLGVPLGVAGAWIAVLSARARLLDPAAAIYPDKWVLAALALTLLAMAGALGLGTLRLLRSSGLAESRSGAPSTTRRMSLVADAVLLVLAVVALVALATSGDLGGRTNPIASAAPGLIALGAAVLAVQLVLFACRVGVVASAHTQRVAPFLALRQIVRRPVVLRQARVLVIALCLACFATSAWSVARANRAALATFAVGTTRVATVTPERNGLEQAVDRFDPEGRFAMAAVNLTTPSSTLLAVQARRLPVAASWPPGISSSTLSAASRALDPPGAPEVRLPDAPVQLAASVKATGAADRGLRDLDLGLWVFNPHAGTNIVNLGPLRSGQRTYRGSVGFVCPGGCRLAGLGVLPAANRDAPASGTIALTVTGVSSGAPSHPSTIVAADLIPGGWRASADGVRVESGAGGRLRVVVPAGAVAADTGAVAATTPPMAAPADHPLVLPAVVTSEVGSLNGASPSFGLVPAQGLDGNTLNVRPAASVSALPGVGSDAVMVDLDQLSRFQGDPTAPYATDQVWLGPAAPANALARLRAAGLRVDGVQTAAAALRAMQRSGPALADDFLLFATIAALLTAAASTLGGLGATTRERATELAALELAGVRRPVLARSLAVESAVLALTALCGALAGVVAAIMAIPSLPELAAPSPIPLQYGLPGGLVAAVTVVVLAVVLLATSAVGLVLIRRMSPLLLRTAPNDTVG
jgi:hypothetical protein